MTVRRGFLYTGVFVLAAGALSSWHRPVPSTRGPVTRALSLWSLAVIAIGVGLMLRGTRAGVAGGMLSAAMPGLPFGGMIVPAPDVPDFADWAAPCGDASRAGEATVLLPGSGDIAGDLAVNAGSLKICAPAGLGLRARGESSLGSTTFNGLVLVGDAWESPDYTTVQFHADVTVPANAGSVVVNPEGGCL